MSRFPTLLAALILVAIPARPAAGEPLRRDTLLATADAHYSVIEVEEAARDWEAFARADPKDSRSPEVHTRAALLRVLLGQDREAATYYMTLDPADAPFLESVRRAFEYCLRLSRSHRIFDEHTRSCEAGFARHFGGELVAYHEFFPTPTWAGPALISRPMKYGH